MSTPQHVPVDVLVAVDGSDVSIRTLEYVADILGGRDHVHVHLLHLHPAFPSHLLEHGGSEDPDRERELDQRLRTERAAWLQEVEHGEAEPLVQRAREILRAGGIEDDAVDVECRCSVDEVAVARECLAAAQERGCRTIAIGRHHLPWYRELFHHHPGDKLVRKATGFTVWVVE